MDIHYGLPEGSDFEMLLRQMPDSEFENLTRSTIPSLFYWKEFDLALARLCEGIGIDSRPFRKLCFEYPVRSAGRNKPSYTDVMCLSDEVVIGVEAKSTERMYDTVKKWLEDGNHSKNRQTVLAHWLNLIRLRTSHIDETLVREVVNQMVHRTASVCSLDAARHVVVYQVFGVDRQASDYTPELGRLATAIHASGKVSIWQHTVTLGTTPEFAVVEVRLQEAEPRGRPEIVRRALMDGGLFTLDKETFSQVT